MLHLAILTHPQDRFEEVPYFLREMAAIWRKEGIRLTVQKGPGGGAADLAILHVDLTVIPGEYLAGLDRHGKVLNARAIDISKRSVTGNTLQPGDDYPGPVIVKTDRNHGGGAEARLKASRGFVHRLRGAVRRRLPWAWRADLADYRIFPSIRHVPAAVWRNRHFVIERFLPERSGDFYCLRTWVFFGDRETNSLSFSHAPIVKSRTIIRRETAPEVPEELRRRRAELGFDFGKFDYGLVGGRPVLYDANRTPTLGVVRPGGDGLEHLAEGLHSFL
jgi:hypothetical protein